MRWPWLHESFRWVSCGLTQSNGTDICKAGLNTIQTMIILPGFITWMTQKGSINVPNSKILAIVLSTFNGWWTNSKSCLMFWIGTEEWEALQESEKTAGSKPREMLKETSGQPKSIWKQWCGVLLYDKRNWWKNWNSFQSLSRSSTSSLWESVG